jgi:hypothetical protein
MGVSVGIRLPLFESTGFYVLAKRVGGWSTTRIRRFYNGRHHTTVLHAIGKIDRLRQTDESLDALIEVLTVALSPQMEGRFTERFESDWTSALVEAVANRVLREIRSRTSEPESEESLAVTQRERGIS